MMDRIGPQNAFAQSLHQQKKKRRRFKGDVYRQRYSEQRMNAARRGVPWRITFDEWKSVWDSSGKWSERGRLRGQYCLSRFNDVGAYERGNVFVQRREENDRQREASKSPELRKQAAQRGLSKRAKLNAEQVLEIRSALSTGAKGCVLAKRYGVCQSAISSVKHGHNWKGVPR